MPATTNAERVAKAEARRLAKLNGYTIRVNENDWSMLDVALTAPDGHLVGGRDVHESIFNTEFEGGPTDTPAALWRNVARDAAIAPDPCTDPACEWCHPVD